MGRKLIIFASSVVFFFAVLYQVALKDLIWITLGVGRTHQKIEEFPFQCKRLRHPLLEACEDMYLDEKNRMLYAACSTVSSRRGWSPGGDNYNASARTLKDHVSVLNIDVPGADGLYGLRQLQITGNYQSSSGDKVIDVHGLDVEIMTDNRLRFWMVNHRPVVDENGHVLDGLKYGDNATIEVFDHTPGSLSLEFVKTIHSKHLIMPNGLVALGDGGVLVTNDHNTKTGRFRKLQMIFGGGSITYCSLTSSCHIASTSPFYFANGITKPSTPKNLIYVAHSAKGYITSHVLSKNQTLSPGTIIPINMPGDNLSIDSEGNIFAIGFPKVLALVGAMEAGEGQELPVPSTVFRIKRIFGNDGRLVHEVEKVFEDIEGEVLPGSTVAVHDVKSDTFWMGGVASPFITVCDRVGNISV